MKNSAKKWAVVTGASQGIGAHMAENLAKRGYSLIVTARNSALLEKLKVDLEKKYSIHVKCFQADLCLAEGVQSLITFCQPFFSEIEVLINNAGFGEVKALTDQKWATCAEMINLNITSLTQLTHAFAEAFKQKKSGSILNVASTAAFQPDPYFAIYGASKSFVLHFSEAIREELQAFNVQVSVLCPGMTETGFHDRAGSRGIKAAQFTMLSVGKVAKIGIDGLLAGKTVIIPGVLNRAIVQSLRLAPRALVAKLSKSLMTEQ